ncbi:transcription factor bHLH120-like [Ziziphus jujuba]|uniref:Transcription factor bHLH120-like n=1 Tax=Ziziphus jujuba TaxID=326968 RepID=A0ABM4AGJ8_ZIZJJ|nr:transcription factor bHLH120-like [Ziziphus jujuba]
MHPLQQNSGGGGGERMICFSSISHEQKSIPEDLIRTTHASVVQFEDGTSSCNTFRSSCSNNIIIGKDWRSRKLLATNLDDKNSYCGKSSFSDGNNKKAIHRDVERERRKQMAAHFSLLRSLIPYEFLRGKRSTSDQMNEAVNYIKHLQMRIQGLVSRRDELKKLCNLNSLGTGNGSLNKCSRSWVSVQPCFAGIQIVVSSSSFIGENFPLTRILQLLLGEGLDLVSCITTKVNERLLYTIQSEVSDPTSTNFSQLQKNLMEAISSWIQYPAT